MDADRFWDCWEKACMSLPGERGIGTLSEKRLHACLKLYYAGDPSQTEVRLGRFVADVFDGERVVEIQTRAFANLKKKLSYFLEHCPVLLVCPIPRAKYTLWTDPHTGESLPLHCARKTARPLEALHELYAIREHLTDPALTVLLLPTDLREVRLLDGTGVCRKKSATRLERIPCSVPEELFLHTPSDYRALLPATLPERFTASEFSRHTKLKRRALYSALHVYETLGVIVSDGTEGRASVYRLVNSGENEEYSSAIPSTGSPENRS